MAPIEGKCPLDAPLLMAIVPFKPYWMMVLGRLQNSAFSFVNRLNVKLKVLQSITKLLSGFKLNGFVK